MCRWLQSFWGQLLALGDGLLHVPLWRQPERNNLHNHSVSDDVILVPSRWLGEWNDLHPFPRHVCNGLNDVTPE